MVDLAQISCSFHQKFQKTALIILSPTKPFFTEFQQLLSDISNYLKQPQVLISAFLWFNHTHFKRTWPGSVSVSPVETGEGIPLCVCVCVWVGDVHTHSQCRLVPEQTSTAEKLQLKDFDSTRSWQDHRTQCLGAPPHQTHCQHTRNELSPQR